MNKQTAREYHFRLANFEKFVSIQYNNNITIDKLIENINNQQIPNGEYDPYEILSNYCIYLQDNGLNTTTLKQRVVTAKNFLEFNDVDISPRKFDLKVKLPKNIKRNKEAIDKNDIINIINSSSEIRLKTYLMFLASTGMRAVEALSIKIKDLGLDSIPPKVLVNGEYTKTKVERYVFLTREMNEQFKKWLEFKYRTRRVCNRDKNTGEFIDEYRTPKKDINEFVFSVRQPHNYNDKKDADDGDSSYRPRHFYNNLVTAFDKTLDRNNMGFREEGNKKNNFFNNNDSRRRGGRRRKITLHSFRRFVKSTISDLGYSDYSEWFIGHAGSTYWQKKDSEKAEIFKKIEPYLTFLNISQLNRQGADLETKIEELQDINHLLRNKQNEKEEQIKNLEESVKFLSDRFNVFLLSQPGNKIIYHEDEDDKNNSRIVKGIELKPEMNNKAKGKVIPNKNKK
ncbi:MAG: tyrosine-type recombinase/integrase [Nitrososphaeraceae archaeon]